MKVTVQDLIEYLSECDPDAEVRLAHQPSWPFEYSINRDRPVVEVDLNKRVDDDDEDLTSIPDSILEPRPTPKRVVYIVEGSQLGYLPGIVKNEIDW